MAKRKRPTLTVTMDADLRRRLFGLAATIPGATVSGIVEEAMKATLPLFEGAAEAIQLARRPDGTIDDDLARREMSAFIGSQLLQLYDTAERKLREEEGTT
jgi:hypothetical protein